MSAEELGVACVHAQIMVFGREWIKIWKSEDVACIRLL